MPVKTLRIPTPDGHSDAIAATPDHGDHHPAVLMYGDAFGIRPALRDMALELARHGYYVLVPNYFYRHGPTPVVDLPDHIAGDARTAIIDQLMPLIHAHTTDRVHRDADAYLEFLAAQPEVSAGPVAVTGYCIGGLLAVRTARTHPDQVAAVAAFHSPVAAFHSPVAADGLDSLTELTAQVHFGHAETDLTPEALTDLNHALDTAGITHTSEIYPGTVHGFTMADTDAYHPDAAQHHWDRLLALLDRTLTS